MQHTMRNPNLLNKGIGEKEDSQWHRAELRQGHRRKLYQTKDSPIQIRITDKQTRPEKKIPTAYHIQNTSYTTKYKREKTNKQKTTSDI